MKCGAGYIMLLSSYVRLKKFGGDSPYRAMIPSCRNS
ncbi:hypothetical protein MKW92_032491 [Papaver armeniacum]|nr:hypothetical protein MKW92_032491 [Papaver armeniacum]